jgi:hypothetical protein
VAAGANDAPLPAAEPLRRKERGGTASRADFRIAEQPAFVLHSIRTAKPA